MIRIANLAKNIIRSNFAELKYPYRFTYIVTYKCQLRCNMCNIWQKPSQNELSLDEVKEFFRKSNNFSWINLSGGEIFLRKDIIDIISVIVKNCKYLYLLDFPTNGIGSESIVSSVKKVIDFKIPRFFITVSLDGPAQVHDEIRGRKGAWSEAVDTFSKLRSLRSRRFNVFFGMTLQPSNIDAIQETVNSVNKQIGDVGYDDFHVNIAHASEHYYANSSMGSDADSKRFWAQMDEIAKKRKPKSLSPVAYLEKRYQNFSKLYFENKKTPLSCQALGASFFMDPPGNIYPCSIFNRPIGNIRDFGYEIAGIWDSGTRRQVRDAIRKGDCPQCWTPCEAYQTILANILPKFKGRKIKCLPNNEKE